MARLDLVRRLGAADSRLAVVGTTRAGGSVHASLVNAGVVDDPVRVGPSSAGFGFLRGVEQAWNIYRAVVVGPGHEVGRIHRHHGQRGFVLPLQERIAVRPDGSGNHIDVAAGHNRAGRRLAPDSHAQQNGNGKRGQGRRATQNGTS